MPAPGLCHQGGAPLTGFGGRCHPEWDPGGMGVPAIQPGHKQRRCKGWGQQAGCAGRHHTRAKPGHLPDRDRLVQPAKGKIERVGRGENQRGQRRGARGKRWSWRRGVRAPVGPNGAVKALAGPPRTVLSWLVHPAQTPLHPQCPLGTGAPQQGHGGGTLLASIPRAPSPPGCLLVHAPLPRARGLLLLRRGARQRQPQAGRAVVGALWAWPGERGGTDGDLGVDSPSRIPASSQPILTLLGCSAQGCPQQGAPLGCWGSLA